MILWIVRAIRRRYHRRQRELDLEFLWPSLKQNANGDIERAKDAFEMHCALNPAWRDVHPDKIAELITTLS
jgi:hypothetical protein